MAIYKPQIEEKPIGTRWIKSLLLLYKTLRFQHEHDFPVHQSRIWIY